MTPPMPTNKPEVVLPELPAITRYRVDGDIAYPVSEDPDGSMVDYDDHVAAMRTYGQACIDTLTRPADEEFVMVPREPTPEMIEAGHREYERALLGDRKNASAAFLRRWKAMLSAAPQQHGQEVDECAANGFGHKFGPHGPGRSIQCEYCGESRQPEEAVALTYDQLFWAISAGMRKIGADGSKHVSVSAFKEALGIDKSDSLYITPPSPAIDIGKLRELADEIERQARDCPTVDWRPNAFDNAHELRALIGGGGEDES